MYRHTCSKAGCSGDSRGKTLGFLVGCPAAEEEGNVEGGEGGGWMKRGEGGA